MLTQANLDAATKRGEVVTQKQLTKAKKVAELSKLLAVLPLGALAKVCNASVTELADMDADGLARHFVTRGRRSMWSVGQARDCRVGAAGGVSDRAGVLIIAVLAAIHKLHIATASSPPWSEPASLSGTRTWATPGASASPGAWSAMGLEQLLGFLTLL